MYEIGALFWSRFVFLTELILAEVLLVWRLKRRNTFWIRLPLAVLGVYALTFAVPTWDNAFYAPFMYLMIFALTVGAVMVLFKERFIKTLFCGVAGYTLQHIAVEVFGLCAVTMGFYGASSLYGNTSFDFMIIYDSTGTTAISGNPFTIMVYGFVYGITYFCGHRFICHRLGGKSDFGVDNKKMFVIAVIILFFDLVVSSVIGAYSQRDYNRVYVAIIEMFNIFCCVFAVYLQFDIDEKSKLQNDLFVIKRLWSEKEEQYAVSKENIELINQKCHDLKHQIRTMGSRGSLDENVVREIEDAISIYDSPVKTGNEALDIILTEKSLYCSRHGIKFCCIIDGEKLSFMSDADLYSLFGNIIDNAVEAVEPLADGKKTISLSIKEVRDFLTINIHNYYDSELMFEGQLPVTTKGDTAYHGYGMKSVQMLCRKYGGELSIKTENKVFNLNIVFPMSGLRTQNDG